MAEENIALDPAKQQGVNKPPIAPRPSGKPSGGKVALNQAFSAFGRDDNIIKSIRVDGGPFLRSGWRVKDGSVVELFGQGLGNYNQVSLWFGSDREFITPANVKPKSNGAGLQFIASFAENIHNNGAVFKVELQSGKEPGSDTEIIPSFYFQAETEEEKQKKGKPKDKAAGEDWEKQRMAQAQLLFNALINEPIGGVVGAVAQGFNTASSSPAAAGEPALQTGRGAEILREDLGEQAEAASSEESEAVVMQKGEFTGAESSLGAQTIATGSTATAAGGEAVAATNQVATTAESVSATAQVGGQAAFNTGTAASASKINTASSLQAGASGEFSATTIQAPAATGQVSAAGTAGLGLNVQFGGTTQASRNTKSPTGGLGGLSAQATAAYTTGGQAGLAQKPASSTGRAEQPGFNGSINTSTGVLENLVAAAELIQADPGLVKDPEIRQEILAAIDSGDVSELSLPARLELEKLLPANKVSQTTGSNKDQDAELHSQSQPLKQPEDAAQPKGLGQVDGLSVKPPLNLAALQKNDAAMAAKLSGVKGAGAKDSAATDEPELMQNQNEDSGEAGRRDQKPTTKTQQNVTSESKESQQQPLAKAQGDKAMLSQPPLPKTATPPPPQQEQKQEQQPENSAPNALASQPPPLPQNLPAGGEPDLTNFIRGDPRKMAAQAADETLGLGTKIGGILWLVWFLPTIFVWLSSLPVGGLAAIPTGIILNLLLVSPKTVYKLTEFILDFVGYGEVLQAADKFGLDKVNIRIKGWHKAAILVFDMVFLAWILFLVFLIVASLCRVLQEDEIGAYLGAKVADSVKGTNAFSQGYEFCKTVNDLTTQIINKKN